jgi:hypothetical protein
MFSITRMAVLAALLVLAIVPTATARPTGPPVAEAAGSDFGVLLYPSLVNVPFVRARGALQRAVDYADDAQPDKAVAQLLAVRLQLKKAWSGEKYLIDNAPPPAPPGDLAFESGAPVSASPFASAEDSGAELFNLYHEVAAMSAGMIDTAKGTLLSALSTTIFATLNARDAAIKYIHANAPPPPPGDLHADSSGAPLAAGWGGVMPDVAPLVDDEIQQLDATLAVKTLSSGSRRVLNAADLQDTKTLRTINQWWPPAPPGD